MYFLILHDAEYYSSNKFMNLNNKYKDRVEFRKETLSGKKLVCASILLRQMNNVCIILTNHIIGSAFAKVYMLSNTLHVDVLNEIFSIVQVNKSCLVFVFNLLYVPTWFWLFNGRLQLLAVICHNTSLKKKLLAKCFRLFVFWRLRTYLIKWKLNIADYNNW